MLNEDLLEELYNSLKGLDKSKLTVKLVVEFMEAKAERLTNQAKDMVEEFAFGGEEARIEVRRLLHQRDALNDLVSDFKEIINRG